MTARIKIIFDRFYVTNDADTFGSGEFYFLASVDGTAVGDRTEIFNVTERRWFDLPDSQWSHIVDVTTAAAVRIRFQGRDKDVFFDDDLGTIQHALRPPWRQRTIRRTTRYFTLEYRVELEVGGRFGRHPGDAIFMCRQRPGAAQYNTVSGDVRRIRVEIHPVRPAPTTGLPPRPRMPGAPAAAVGLGGNASPTALQQPWQRHRTSSLTRR